MTIFFLIPYLAPVAWPALRLVARSFDSRVERLVVEVGSAAVCGLGLFWFVERAYAG